MSILAADTVPRAGRVLGMDLGTRRIGIAVCDGEQRLATGVRFVARSGDRPGEHRALAQLVAEYEAVGAVVGLPLSLDGTVGPAAQRALDEVTQLRAAFAVPVETVDERLTTVSASSALRAAGVTQRRQRGVIDQTAAAALLQTWLDRRAVTGHD